MERQASPWNEWYRRHDKEGDSAALWAGVRKVVHYHRYRKLEDNDATANIVMYKFIVFAEIHRGEIEGGLFSDSRLEAIIHKITHNELISEYRMSRGEMLVQIDTRGSAGDEREGARSGAVHIDELIPRLAEGDPEQAIIDREIDAEIMAALYARLSTRQRYIFDSYWDFDGDRSDRNGHVIAKELDVSIATFNREVKVIKRIVLEVCLDARKRRRGLGNK